jgi:hypothetical protein
MTNHNQEPIYNDFNFDDFVEKLYNNPPQEPFSYTLEFLQEIPKDHLQNYLGHILMTGAKQLYNTELACLSIEQIDYIRKYLHSIGWDADYKVEQKTLNGQKYNHFQIDFFACKRDLDIQNKPRHLD